MFRIATLAGLLLTLVGCATNPVTGRSELSMVSRAQEIEIGRQQYQPAQQSQGGLYKVDPDVGDYVSEVGQRLAAVSDNPLPYEFVVLNNSVPNAWALPGGKIAINRGLLLEMGTEAELAAVLGHEIVHSAARHGAQAITRSNLLQGAVMVGALATRDSQYAEYIVGASQLGAQLINQRYGREAELESDAFGMRYMLEAGYDPREAVSLQETFVRLSEGRQQDWLSGLFSSHPPSEERVRNNRALAEELLAGQARRDLEVGEDRYRQAMATLRETAPAYEDMDTAREAINEGNFDRALGLLDQAIAAVPQEARFHGLKADILLHRERFGDAVAAYDDAIARDDAYFSYYLGRGLTLSRLGRRQQARADLEKSADLLPTTIAMNELGKLALQQNDRQSALQYFRQAAEGQGEAAREAARAFVRLDIRDNPERYLGVEALVDEAGQIVARAANLSGVTLENIRLTVLVSVSGRVTQTTLTVPSLEGGETRHLPTGLELPEDFVQGVDAVRINVDSMAVPD